MVKPLGNSARGFTLLEQIVVVAVLLILMGLLLAVVSKSKGSGRNALAKSELEKLIDQLGVRPALLDVMA